MHYARHFSAVVAFVASLSALAVPAAQAQSLDRIKLPPGFRIEQVTDQVPDARAMTFSPAGTLYVGSRGAGKVYAVAAPLSGSAYFVRRASGRGLPDLVVQLRGEVAIDLVGKVTVKGTQLVTTFDTIPDVPLSRFQLKLPAKTSPVSSVAGLCTKAGRNGLARQTMRGQNGKLVQRKARLAIAGCAKRR